MKVKVKRCMNGARETIYIATEKDFKGRQRTFSDAEYKANPGNFEVVGGLTESLSGLVDGVGHRGVDRKIVREGFEAIHEVSGQVVKLPKPLSELDELVQLLAVFRRGRTDEQLMAEARNMKASRDEHNRQLKLKESWQAAGLSEPAAEVAARVEIKHRPADLPPVEEWAGLLGEAYSGRK